MSWRTRKRGTRKQRGTRFLAKQKARSNFKIGTGKVTTRGNPYFVKKYEAQLIDDFKKICKSLNISPDLAIDYDKSRSYYNRSADTVNIGMKTGWTNKRTTLVHECLHAKGLEHNRAFTSHAGTDVYTARIEKQIFGSVADPKRGSLSIISSSGILKKKTAFYSLCRHVRCTSNRNVLWYMQDTNEKRLITGGKELKKKHGLRSVISWDGVHYHLGVLNPTRYPDELVERKKASGKQTII